MREKLKRLAIYLLLLAFFIPGITGRRIDAQAAEIPEMIRRQQRSESVRLLRHCHQSRL